MTRLALAPVLAALAAACGSEPTVAPRAAPTPDGFAAVRGDLPRSPRLANYAIDASYDANAHRITARETLTWTNGGNDPVDTLPFHLYLNAFKNQDSLFFRSSGGQHRGQHASKHGWGWIEVDSIRVNGGAEARSRAHFTGPDQTVLELPVDAPVPPGATVRVAMTFTSQLPEVYARTGYKGRFAMVGQWFPKIGVRIDTAGGERWHCEPFHSNSEFFADFGVYDVSLTVPTTHIVAATGVLTNVTEGDDGTRTLRYHAEDVHDFAWMIDPFMQVIRGTAHNQLGDVEVRVYYRPAQAAFARRHLQAAIGAIEQFSALYVPYPWPIMSVIDPPPDASGSAGGMEYPTLVTTAGDAFFAAPDGVRIPEYVTIHEVGHNWFQGMLASNEVEEAWMDEGVNEYADSLVMDTLYGDNGFVHWMGFSADTLQIRRISDVGALPSPIATRAAGFPDFGAYADATYNKTGLALRTLENIIGPERFRAAMKVYTQEQQFHHPTGADLWRTLSRELGEDLDWFVRPVFDGRGAVDLRIRTIDCRREHPAAGVFGLGDARHTVTLKEGDGDQICDITIENVGQVLVPVDFDVVFGDGARLREHWDGKGDWYRVRTQHATAVTEVVIDPERKILLDSTLLKDAERAGDERGPGPAAAGARAQFWTQSLMQMGGL